MNESNQNQEDQPDAVAADSSTAAAPSPPGFRAANVGKVLVPAILLAAVVYLFFGYFDGMNWLASLATPPLAPVTGTITYQGKPLAGAQIFSRPLRSGVQGSIGWTEDDGVFKLRTDIEGNYVDGAYVGEHVLTVTAYETLNAPAQPPLTTPAEYASFDHSPLKITVTRDAAQNRFELELVGEPPSRDRAGGGPGGGRGGPPSAADIVARLLENFDTDGDGALSLEEAGAVDAERLQRMRRADADDDENVTPEELVNWVAEQQAATSSESPQASEETSGENSDEGR